MTFEIDPEIAAAAAPLMASMEGVEPFAVGDVEGRRRLMEPMTAELAGAQPYPADVEAEVHHLAVGDGVEIELRWFRKRGAPERGPAVLYIHGGGMIMGSVSLYAGPVARYVSRSGVPMLAVDYRRAPEHPHPVPVEDCYAGLTWLAEHAAELGVDRDRVGVMGDSAGGGLAAAVAILARDRGGPSLARQILIYPMLDDRNTVPDPSIEPFAFWTYEDNLTGWRALLGDRVGTPGVPATAAPARLGDATGLPPAYIEVGQLDIFRDEALEFARRLSAGAVPVEFHLHPGVPHDYEVIAFGAEVAIRSGSDRTRVLQGI